MKLPFSNLLYSVLITALCFLVASCGVDKTLNDGASGSDVVHAVIAKLDATRIFDNDHRLLRRLAFVESADGAKDDDALCSDGGGIWALQESKFDVVLSSTELASVREGIRLAFGIDWRQITIRDLCKPFYAGLAARMYLYYLEITATARIPLAGNIAEQAQFWITYYHLRSSGLTIDYFIAQVSLLEEKEGLF